jgi:hypothetical protein
MRIETIEYKIYEFDELNEASKERVLSNLWDINVEYGWWEHLKEEAEEWGATRFDFNLYIHGHIFLDVLEPVKFAENIVASVGDQSRLYKPAKEFLDALDAGELEEVIGPEYMDTIELEFFELLQDEYDYLTSDEAIIETIKANGYEFLENGKIY